MKLDNRQSENDFGVLHSILSRILSIPEKFKYDSFRSNHLLRRRFYVALRDFVNSPNTPAPENFFQKYLEKLDSREAIAAPLVRWFRRVTKQKGDKTLRQFLSSCANSAAGSAMLAQILEPWIPSDELLILRSNMKANISDAVSLAIELTDEKYRIDQELRATINKNALLFIVGFFMHYIMYQVVLEMFANPIDIESKPWEELSPVDKGYFIYDWIAGNGILICLVIAGLFGFIYWLNQNWHKKYVIAREAVFDYIPPFSLSKVNHQYMTLIAIENQMTQGISFPVSLENILENSTPYQKLQIQRILSRVTESATDAIATPYFGDWGIEIKERGEYHKIQTVIRDLLPQIKEERSAKVHRILNRYVFGMIKPLIIATLIAAVTPVALMAFNQISEAQSIKDSR